MGSGFEVSSSELIDSAPSGIIPRAVTDMFNRIKQFKSGAASISSTNSASPSSSIVESVQNSLPSSSSTSSSTTIASFTVQVQFIELYNEEIIDLLDETRDFEAKNKKSNIKIHEDSCGNIYVTGITTKTVHNEKDVSYVERYA